MDGILTYMIKPPSPTKSGSILLWANKLIAYLMGERLVSGQGILVKRTPYGTTLSVTAGGSAAFTGVYYFKAIKYALDMSGAKAYWYHDSSDNTAHWSDGPMATTMPDNQYWRETATCGAVVYILC